MPRLSMQQVGECAALCGQDCVIQPDPSCTEFPKAALPKQKEDQMILGSVPLYLLFSLISIAHLIVYIPLVEQQSLLWGYLELRRRS